MANPISLPLQEKLPRNNIIRRVADILILFLLISLLLYRLLNLNGHSFVWQLALLCETCFTFIWILNTSTRWNFVDYKTYPDRFLKRFEELPALDMFVTTADSSIEPPIKTMNTVISLLAVDYPANKLACYVSDDGGSIITFYALIEASKFAKLWVPFCKKYSVGVRAPFMYFSKEPETVAGDSSDFLNDWRKMKDDYEELSQKISEAAQKSIPCNLNNEFMDFYEIERGNHASIVKVIWENKDNDPNGLPHIIYVSREKRPKHHHNFKAGALNVLMRISGIMTNAPFILNVDCDMFTNNPQVVLHAMCLLFGFEKERESGFVQFRQEFYDCHKDDPFGTSLIVLAQLLLDGMAGIQGPLYAGTGCFHRRKVIYGGLPPDDEEIKKANLNSMKDLQRRFGYSKEFVESVTTIMLGTSEEKLNMRDLSSALKAANEVSGCQYEFNTSWGQEVGLVYGSTNEDVITGMKIHGRGWESKYCTPKPPVFLGCTATGGPSCMTQNKRWATGLLQILIGKHSPLIVTFTTKLRFRQCLAYMIPTIWALRSLPELCYSLLVAFCLLTNTTFLPKVSEPAILIPIALFAVYNIYTLVEYRSFGYSFRGWWNNQRMSRITTVSAWLFGALGFCLDLLGISPAVFEVTRKDENTHDSNLDSDPGRFTFDSSPIFVPGVTLVFVHTTALVVGLLRLQPARPVFGASGSGLGEILCSLWVLLSFLPFVKGLFRKGSYGIPWSVILKAAILALFFVRLCVQGLEPSKLNY
ncbi:cellulose synthase-like protein H1 isoform X2 [Magnolia sinica]|uniref:cellulose synthase-like protein H1 isoform X2 n=1 Tax=Magnolia sinica TaxID=86752 RepID=UPI00265A513E|nr:cellulose synthase-like protein H1 isoform X2 [Magnolia sinica]